MKRIIMLTLLLGIAGAGLLLFFNYPETQDQIEQPIETPQPTVSPAHPAVLEAAEISPPPATGSIVYNVPFTAQAPIGNWEDINYQNACEEASIIMAMRWVHDLPLSTEEAMDEIAALIAFQKEHDKHNYDISAADTAKLIQAYYDHEDVTVHIDITADDIIEELHNNKVILVPADGRKLQNPYFSAPGPEYHMLVIKGYNNQTKEFITNDPGTRHGESYRYARDVLLSAIRDYPTGYHEKITKDIKTMIAVGK